MKRFFFCFLFSIALIIPLSAQADYRDDLDKQLQATAGTQGANFGEAVDPRIAAAVLIRNVLTLLGTLLLVYVVWGGFLWMTSAGNEDRIEKGKLTIVRGAVGLIIILSAYSITLFVTQFLTPNPIPGSPADSLEADQRQYMNDGLEEDATPFAI